MARIKAAQSDGFPVAKGFVRVTVNTTRDTFFFDAEAAKEEETQRWLADPNKRWLIFEKESGELWIPSAMIDSIHFERHVPPTD